MRCAPPLVACCSLRRTAKGRRSHPREAPLSQEVLPFPRPDDLADRLPQRQAPRQGGLDAGVPRDPGAGEERDVVRHLRAELLGQPVEPGYSLRISDVVVLHVEEYLSQERPRDDVVAPDGLHRGRDELEVGDVATGLVLLAEVDVDGGGAIERHCRQGALL